MNLTIGFLICLLFGVTVLSQETTKIDEFENLNCDDYLGRMDSAIAEARKNPLSRMYVLIYEGKEPRYNKTLNGPKLMSPTLGTAEAKIRSIKKWLSHREIQIERFSFVKAGFRENMTVEMWLVPAGSKPPDPTPTLKKIKYRKGKAKGFCTDCC